MTIPSPAAESEDLRNLRDAFIRAALTPDYLGDDYLMLPRNDKKFIDRLVAVAVAQNNATYEAVMEAIGEDEHIQHFSFHGRSNIRDELRAELRQSIAKIFRKESSNE